jgi:hypothetical protein
LLFCRDYITDQYATRHDVNQTNEEGNGKEDGTNGKSRYTDIMLQTVRKCFKISTHSDVKNNNENLVLVIPRLKRDIEIVSVRPSFCLTFLSGAYLKKYLRYQLETS